VVVFGVVDKALMNQVGLPNYSWWNDKKKYDTTVKVADPSEALHQMLVMCDNDANCMNKRKVLLAQMPLQKARQVIEQLQKLDIQRSE
jgi:hypothetical protein